MITQVDYLNPVFGQSENNQLEIVIKQLEFLNKDIRLILSLQ